MIVSYLISEKNTRLEPVIQIKEIEASLALLKEQVSRSPNKTTIKYILTSCV